MFFLQAWLTQEAGYGKQPNNGDNDHPDMLPWAVTFLRMPPPLSASQLCVYVPSAELAATEPKTMQLNFCKKYLWKKDDTEHFSVQHGDGLSLF